MVTRSSLVWVMTGIAAGIAGGWLWNRTRAVEVTPSTTVESRSEPIRSPFAPRREERATYLSSSESGESSAAADDAQLSSEFSQRQSVYDAARHMVPIDRPQDFGPAALIAQEQPLRRSAGIDLGHEVRDVVMRRVR